MNKLLVSVLGHRDSGKTTTWSTLFRTTVKTGTKSRKLYFSDANTEYVYVFLISGSPEERGIDVEELIKDEAPIVLCSAQYRADVMNTYNYFFNNGYDTYVQWLNPGVYGTTSRYHDNFGLLSELTNKGSVMCVRDGRDAPIVRVNEIRAYIYGWAKFRGLIKTDV